MDDQWSDAYESFYQLLLHDHGHPNFQGEEGRRKLLLKLKGELDLIVVGKFPADVQPSDDALEDSAQKFKAQMRLKD